MKPRTLTILGAAGSLGRHVAAQAKASGLRPCLVVRSPDRLPEETAENAEVVVADLMSERLEVLARLADGRDALICCAGNVTEGQRFVALVDRVVTAVESLPDSARPRCWFMAGAALLDLDASGRKAVEFPQISETYWPHLANFERLSRSNLQWSLLCPGPMVDQPAVGLERLRISMDRLPVDMPADADRLSPLELMPHFVARLPEMIVPYADAAILMLTHASHPSAMSRKRVGLALPVGMRGTKERWTARPAER